MNVAHHHATNLCAAPIGNSRTHLNSYRTTSRFPPPPVAPSARMPSVRAQSPWSAHWRTRAAAGATTATPRRPRTSRRRKRWRQEHGHPTRRLATAARFAPSLQSASLGPSSSSSSRMDSASQTGRPAPLQCPSSGSSIRAQTSLGRRDRPCKPRRLAPMWAPSLQILALEPATA